MTAPMSTLTVAPHPSLELAAFAARFPAPLGAIAVPDDLRGRLVRQPAVDERVRAAVRDLLRHGGYKPTGRGKPSSEYLARAVADGALASINVAVDAGNAASLASGLPISVVDLDRARPPLRAALAADGDRFVFNAAGQEIDLAGLLCLFDADGPCANAVKDAQRTKTTAATTGVLVVVWGTRALPGRAAETAASCRALCEQAGATTTPAAADGA